MSIPSLKEIAPWTRRIIWINVILFALGQAYRWVAELDYTEVNPITEFMSLRVDHLLEGRVWELFTYMWVHSDFLIIHVIFNMMTLYFVGRVVEFKLGGKAFLWIYLVGGLASVGLFLFDIGVQGVVLGQSVDLSQPLVGASGAVCAVLGAFSLLVPDTKLIILFLPWPVRAIKMVKGVVWFSVLAMLVGWIPAIRESPSVGWVFSIAHSAHLGGILFGWWFFHKMCAVSEPEYVPYRPVESSSEEKPVASMNLTELRQALEPVRSKISSQGIEHLTERELEILRQGRRVFG